MLNASAEDFALIFVNSATGGIKLIGESFQYGDTELQDGGTEFQDGDTDFHYGDTDFQYGDTEFEDGADALKSLRSDYANQCDDKVKPLDDNFQDGVDGVKDASLIYLENNHTSVLGMREQARRGGVRSGCISNAECAKRCSVSPKPRSHGDGPPGLFVYPAQSNFSGVRYPLKWIRSVKSGALSTGFNR